MKQKSGEMQRVGRNKRTLVDRTFIASGEYRKKVDKISDNPNTISIVAKETNGAKESNVIYSKKTKRIISAYDNLITVHSHPHSYPPSVNDFNSNFLNNYGMGIICCHDGKVFLYNAKQKINFFAYKAAIAKYRKKGYDEYDAQLLSLEEMKKIDTGRVRFYI